jgi:hypothetical protein
MDINAKNPKMSFNGQPNMFFGMFISFICDLHLKLDILNPLNINFLSNGFLNESSPCNLLFQNFKILKKFNNSGFHQVRPMNMYFHIRGHVFVVQKNWNQLYDLMSSFWLLFLKNILNNWFLYFIGFKRTLT